MGLDQLHYSQLGKVNIACRWDQAFFGVHDGVCPVCPVSPPVYGGELTLFFFFVNVFWWKAPCLSNHFGQVISSPISSNIRLSMLSTLFSLQKVLLLIKFSYIRIYLKATTGCSSVISSAFLSKLGLLAISWDRRREALSIFDDTWVRKK